jgi:hypothetical protein
MIGHRTSTVKRRFHMGRLCTACSLRVAALHEQNGRYCGLKPLPEDRSLVRELVVRTHEAGDEAPIRALLDYLNACHDGSLRRITFRKARGYTNEGDLFYPSQSQEDWRTAPVPCDIEMELLLNSYIGASPRQIVLLRFDAVRSFQFSQNSTYDYSDIYEVNLSPAEPGTVKLSFCATAQKIETLMIICSKVVCTELPADAEPADDW